MTAAETIAAAIEKLEGERAAATSGPWDSGLVGVYGPEGYVASDGDMWLADRQLIVTLHCTIDAQLAILRHGLDLMTPWAGMAPLDETAHYELALAHAILGEAL